MLFSKSLFRNNFVFLSVISLVFFFTTIEAQGVEGYYRYPAVHGSHLVFSAEGDLWKVSIDGGIATRLTTHLGEESHPAISPDGKTIAFSATYEGPTEIYTMPYNGGLPIRQSYEAESSIVNTWTSNGEIAYTTSAYSTLPNAQMVLLNPTTHEFQRIPLHQASEGSFSEDGRTLYFVRPAYHRNVTKRYVGGTARKIWKYTEGEKEAELLTADYAGGSHTPMSWKDRVYFISDRDGIMNIWSMKNDGSDFRQHTGHPAFDVRDASLSDGKIVYQLGADLWLYDIDEDETTKLDITLASDLDQLREKWVHNPEQYITSVHPHPNGDQIVITARGRVFVASTGDGRLVQLSRKEGVRYRDAVFSADGKHIIVLSDESGEFEFVQIPSTGIGEHQALTDNGEILRYTGIPSPDGKYLAFTDHNRDLWVHDLESGNQERISSNREGVRSPSWSPDSRWLAYTQSSTNSFVQIYLYSLVDGKRIELTTDRSNSTNPTFSMDGKWLYFLSDRNFRSLVGSPWGPRQPEPYFDKKMKIYEIALQKNQHSPFKPEDELGGRAGVDSKSDEPVQVIIDEDRLQRRIKEVPVSPGNYFGLAVNEKTMYFLSRGTGLGATTDLMALRIDSKGDDPVKFITGTNSFEMSQDGKKIMFRKGRDVYMVNAGSSPVSKIGETKVDLSGWAFSMDVREDWKQLYTDAWRMERDYFYDQNMHGLDWRAMYEKYLPLVDRVTTRIELSDVIGRFVGELSALHTSVRGGDIRTGDDNIRVATLGARLSRNQSAGGYRIDYIYQSDPEYPDQISPLADPDLNISIGDMITHVNGESALSGVALGKLLRNQAGRNVRIGLRSADGQSRDVMVVPLSSERNLRYSDWEYTRRLEVEERGLGKIGYVHLRAMGSNDISQWYREFYPIFNRQGLIIDVRHNNGGNIDAFILEKLMRKAWMYWKGRVQNPTWNMHYAFRGHMVVLVDQNTASDGEAFAEGFRRLGLGKVIGTRTWGGEIWLGSANRLTDGGLARAPMTGVYGPEGEWLIEGHGVDPDIVVDNLPHETFHGRDAQLEAAIEHLHELIAKDPRAVPAPPKHPDMSFKAGGGKADNGKGN